jgi:hypothetical protein
MSEGGYLYIDVSVVEDIKEEIKINEEIKIKKEKN